MRFRRNSLISPVFLVLLLMLILGGVAGQLVGKGSAFSKKNVIWISI